MKRSREDVLFSKYERLRDNYTCQRCGTQHEQNSRGLHSSHYFGRSGKSVRWDENNCIALCYGCHRIWASKDREQYRNFMLEKLGQKEFDDLTERSENKKTWKKRELEELRDKLKRRIIICCVKNFVA